jgi:hypothetical protein
MKLVCDVCRIQGRIVLLSKLLSGLIIKFKRCRVRLRRKTKIPIGGNQDNGSRLPADGS